VKIIFIFFLFFLFECSLNPNSKLWTSKNKIAKDENLKIINITSKDEILNKEINVNFKLNINSTEFIEQDINIFDNNYYSNYDGKLKNISKYRFSKIKKFDEYDPELSFQNTNIIFFNNRGTILKFDDNSKLLWKKNYYKKSEIKKNPILFFSSNSKYLVIADTLAKTYALNIENGKLIWTHYSSSPFNSQIKIIDDNFYVVDMQNTLHCFSLIDGKKKWSYKTDAPLIKSQKRLSIVAYDKKVIFNNSIGDVTAVSNLDGSLLWQTPTQSSKIYNEAMFYKISDLVIKENNLFFSDNANNFYSIDLETGALNWKQKINSSLRPVILNNIALTVTNEGYFVVIKKKNGNIIKSVYLLKKIKKKKRKKIKFTGFATGKNKIYLASSIGRLFIINISTGEIEDILKIDNEKISRPIIYNNNLYVTKNNSVIKLN